MGPPSLSLSYRLLDHSKMRGRSPRSTVFQSHKPGVFESFPPASGAERSLDDAPRGLVPQIGLRR